jgi:hypothetical protein
MDIFHSTATLKEQLPAIQRKCPLTTIFPNMQCFTPFLSTKCQILPHRRKKLIDKAGFPDDFKTV